MGRAIAKGRWMMSAFRTIGSRTCKRALRPTLVAGLAQIQGNRRREGVMRRLEMTFVSILLAASPLLAGDVFQEVEYVSGRTGLDHKVKGQLVIDDHAVSFKDKNGADVFTLAMSTISSASSSVDRDEGSFGRKMALGIFASKTEEFLTLHTEGPQGAEAIMLKCKKHTSQGMVDKIEYQLKHASQTAATQ
jgi:hypothetical protein